MTVYPIPAFSDNYIWLIQSRPDFAAVVDPGDAQPVLAHLTEHNVQLTTILITHHHADHIGGIATLLEHYPNAQVIGSKDPRCRYVNTQVQDGDQLQVEGVTTHVFEVPGHTSSHIAFLMDNKLFCGDTLFSAGCGRLFEGSPEQMFQSLQKLMQLPESTEIYCTHEYTQANLRFALTIEPNNQALQEYNQKVAKLREANQPSLPSCIALEKNINPFLRCNESSVIDAAQRFCHHKLAAGVETFAQIRLWKDQF